MLFMKIHLVMYGHANHSGLCPPREVKEFNSEEHQ